MRRVDDNRRQHLLFLQKCLNSPWGTWLSEDVLLVIYVVSLFTDASAVWVRLLIFLMLNNNFVWLGWWSLMNWNSLWWRRRGEETWIKKRVWSVCKKRRETETKRTKVGWSSRHVCNSTIMTWELKEVCRCCSRRRTCISRRHDERRRPKPGKHGCRSCRLKRLLSFCERRCQCHNWSLQRCCKTKSGRTRGHACDRRRLRLDLALLAVTVAKVTTVVIAILMWFFRIAHQIHGNIVVWVMSWRSRRRCNWSIRGWRRRSGDGSSIRGCLHSLGTSRADSAIRVSFDVRGLIIGLREVPLLIDSMDRITTAITSWTGTLAGQVRWFERRRRGWHWHGKRRWKKEFGM